MDAAEIKRVWDQDGYISPLRVLSEDAAADHRQVLEATEAQHGKLHYKYKMHTVLKSPWEVATSPVLLDAVEAILGPNILLYNVTYIIKEPKTETHISWHQDLTFWGLSNDNQVTAWLALSPATQESGCMRMLPGSHHGGRHHHEKTEDPSNALAFGQTVGGIDENSARLAPLQPGEASLHHGWTLHASMPNNSDDRRIGLNIQYLATDVKQVNHDEDSAILVRGRDDFRHFKVDVPAMRNMHPVDLARRDELDARQQEIYEAMEQPRH
ncbi:MAG: phytanoyl-CoA dioxygenase family protein [Alphaproteobacteria bacterium]